MKTKSGNVRQLKINIFRLTDDYNDDDDGYDDSCYDENEDDPDDRY